MLDPNLPQNALCNVRAYVEDFIGAGKTGVNIENLIETVVMRIHRRWHPKWAKTYVDADIPITTGSTTFPSDYKKLSRITNQTNEPTTFYEPGVDYDLQDMNTSVTDPRRKLQWISPPESTALPVRIWYWRKPRATTSQTDLIDLNPDAIDLVLYGCMMLVAVKDASIDAYDRWNRMFEDEMQRWIDDDMDLDASLKSIPQMSDGSVLSYADGEIV